MTSDQAHRFLRALRVTNPYDKGKWVTASCPLAPWTHRHAQDSSPSFGLTVSDEQKAAYHCFACRSGSAEELLHALELYAGTDAQGYDFAQAHRILSEERINIATLPGFEEFPHPGPQFEAWPGWWLDSFVHALDAEPSWQYLDARGVPDAVARQFDLRYDSARDMLVAPYRTVYGALAGARGRAIHPALQDHYDYTCGGVNNALMVWFNEPALEHDGPVVVVEGQFDCMRVAARWPKVVANLTAKPTWEKMKKLADSRVIIQIPDNDETGEQSVQSYAKLAAKLGLELRVLKLPGSVKDPDDCHPDFLYDRIAEVARTL